MIWLRNLVYLAALVAASPWLAYAALTKGKYRQGLSAKLFGNLPNRRSNQPCVWCHAVSVGEVNVLAPLIVELRRRQPRLEFVITTTTRTGYELARRKYAEHTVCYCPLDFSWAVRRAFKRLRPQLLVLAELELWPNLIHFADRQGIPVAVVNGRLSERSAGGYRRWRRMLQSTFDSLKLVAVQNATYGQRFLELGIPGNRIHVTGSMKFDGAEMDRGNPRTAALRQWAQIDAQDIVWIAGSTQDPEESFALEVFSKLRECHRNLRLIVVPRHPERFAQVARLLERSGIPWARRSRDPHGRQPVILVDTVGELGAWWGLADLAYVGGSMGAREGQNMIEPAAYGAAVSFGSRTRNFRDVVELLLQAQASVVVRDHNQMAEFVDRGIRDARWRHELGARARNVVASQLGAVERTAELLIELMPETGTTTCHSDAA